MNTIKPNHILFQSPKQASLFLVLSILALHLLLAGQVNLSVDEAHYALYGEKLDWSYFDHPPMVGWLNALILPFSHSDWALRLIPITFFALSNLLLYRIATRLYPDFTWIGFWTLALINSAIMFQLLSLSMLPDTPLMIAALMTFWSLLNLRDKPCLKNWLWLGFWLGIAALSKYTAITLVFSILLIMFIEKRWYWLKQPGLYAAIALTSLLILPILYWNAQHDWISFLYQLHHGTYNDHWSWLSVGQTQIAQFFVYTPILFLVGFWLALTGFFKGEANRLLASFSLPTLVLFAMGSGYEMSLPHWTQLAWLFISPAVVYFLWQHWSSKVWRWSIYASSVLALASSILLTSLIITPWLSFPPNKNPLQDLYGWPQAIKIAQKLQKQHHNAPLFVQNWTQASRAAWYAYPQPVYVTDNRFDQFDLWFSNPKANSNGILILPSYESKTPKLARPGHFSQCKLLQTLTLAPQGIHLVTYRFYNCHGFIPVQYSGWITQLKNAPLYLHP